MIERAKNGKVFMVLGGAKSPERVREIISELEAALTPLYSCAYCKALMPTGRGYWHLQRDCEAYAWHLGQIQLGKWENS